MAKHAETQCCVTQRLSGSKFQLYGPTTAKHRQPKLFR